MASKLAGHHYAGGKLADRQAIFGESHVAGRGSVVGLLPGIAGT
jgi:hypothetical protein